MIAMIRAEFQIRPAFPVQLPVYLEVAVGTQCHQILQSIIPLLASFDLVVNLQVFQ